MGGGHGSKYFTGMTVLLIAYISGRGGTMKTAHYEQHYNISAMTDTYLKIICIGCTQWSSF